MTKRYKVAKGHTGSLRGSISVMRDGKEVASKIPPPMRHALSEEEVLQFFEDVLNQEIKQHEEKGHGKRILG